MKPQSLAEFLDINDPRTSEDQAAASEAPTEPTLDGVENVEDPKKFCERVLASREFRQYILRGIVLGDIPPGIVTRLMDHGWGKPIERLEVSEPSALENLTPELAVQKLERVERMLQLLRRAQIDDEEPKVTH